MHNKEQRVLRLVQRFIAHHYLTCAESVWQSDNVREAAPEFIEALCEVAGYHIPEDEPESSYAEFNRIKNA
jgi:hypothetical protein